MPLSDIKQWDEIKENFEGADILLGNGFSVNLNSNFTYDALFNVFVSRLADERARIFNQFNTSNFETILKSLKNTKKTNNLFNIDCKPIEDAIVETRNGLIEAIQQNHPTKHDIDWTRLEKVGKELIFFNDVFTLNYDMLLYHTILALNDLHNRRELDFSYSDFHWGKIDDKFLGFKYPQTYPNVKSVYYLHGAVFLFNDGIYSKKRKLTRWQDELLECVKSEIEVGQIPLFISEGTSKEKTYMIRQNNYLFIAYSDFMRSNINLVIYGASLQNSDKHIVDAINKKLGRRIAISIYLNGQNEEEIDDEIQRYSNLFKNQQISFFDSSTLFS